MDHILIIGSLLSLLSNTALLSGALRVSSTTVDASHIIFEPVSSSPRLLRLNSSMSFQEHVQVPLEAPCFLVFESKSNQSGRMNLFLEPVQFPEELQVALTEQEQPVKDASFQVVIDTEAGGWRLHTLDVAADFFETVRPSTLPYNPAGTTIKRVRLEVAEPSRPELEISIRKLKVVKLTSKAMKEDLAGRMRDLSQRLATLKKGSNLRAHWESEISKMMDRVETFNAAKGEGAYWRKLALALEQYRLQSENWHLSDRPYAVAADSSLRRISGNHPGFTFRGSAGGEVYLQAGINEYESFQLVILPLTGNLEDVRIETGDLVSSEGGETIAGQNFEFFHQVEQFVQPSRGTAYDWAGWLPDALLPVEGSFEVRNFETKPVWVTLYVPEDAVAGTYKGKIRIIPAGETETVLSVKLQVHPFAIPRVGRFRTQGHLSLEDLKAWYKDRYTAEVRKDFYRLLVRYRQSPTSQYSARLSPDFEDIPWIMSEGGNVILIGGFSGQDLDPDIIGPAYEWLVENDYIAQAIIYVGDETNDFEKMRAKARAIRQNWPKLRIMIGGSKPREELIGYFDVWDPITYGGDVYNFDLESTKAAVERGEEMFWYTCVGPRSPYANVYNDHPLTAIRALWWQAWKYEVTGFEYWWFNYWRPNIALSEGSSPWPTSRKREWSSRSFKWANGDGVLVYPGPNGKALPSIRLSVMRDAIEDWEVLFMLRRTVELARESNIPAAGQWIEPAERLLAVPEEITSSLAEWSWNPEVYSKARAETYRLLTGLRNMLGREQADRYTDEWVERHQSWLQKKFEQRVAGSR